MKELLEMTATNSMTQAVNAAVDDYIRQHRLRQLRALRGKVDILSNEEIEAAELRELKRIDE